VAGISTARAVDRFYSHRAEGRTGRFIAAASLRPA
jgi:copper oxidase (laccase) domain-containing protein